MKNIISIIVIYIGLFLIDKRASSYGNGVIHLYKHLKYHISLTKINHNYFLYGDLGYIMPQEYYDGLYIENIVGYEESKDELKIYISTNNDLKSLSFYSEKMVMDKNPIIRKENTLPNINFNNIPYVYYYWKIIFIIGVLISIVLGINLLYRCIIKFFR